MINFRVIKFFHFTPVVEYLHSCSWILIMACTHYWQLLSTPKPTATNHCKTHCHFYCRVMKNVESRARLSEWVKVALSCLTLCNPMDHSPPGSSVHWILQARILEWVAYPFSRGTSRPRNQPGVSCITDEFFTSWVTQEAWHKVVSKEQHRRPWQGELDWITCHVVLEKQVKQIGPIHAHITQCNK